MDIDQREGIRICWAHLPESGGYYDQDEWMMAIWETTRTQIIKALTDERFLESLRSKHGKSTA